MNDTERRYEGLVSQEHFNSLLKPTAQFVIGIADALMFDFPQYDGHFDQYRLVRITRQFKTKMGVAFEEGDIAIAKPYRCNWDNTLRVCAFSFRNVCDTIVNSEDIEYI